MENFENNNKTQEIHEEKIEELQVKKEETFPRKRMGIYFATIVVLSSLFGALFGFMAGKISNGDLSTLLKKNLNKGEGGVNTEKIVVEDSEVIDIVEKSTSGVVSIVITKDVPTYRPLDFFGFGIVPEENIGTEKQRIGGGTGFFISSDGMIATNKHVVEDEAAEYTVITEDEKKYVAKVLARDPVNDIAIIKIEGDNFPVLPLGDSASLKIGQTVIAIGNSLGEFSNTVSRGIISGSGRTLVAGDALGSQTERLTDIIQTDAAINPGNSGGPLISMNGDVIGMNVAIVQGAQSIGFALPVNQLKRVADQVKENGKISYPFLGVRYAILDEEYQKLNKLPYNYGVLVLRGESYAELAVIPGSPADKAGIVEGDIILEFDGIKIDKNTQLSNLIISKNVGDSVNLKIYHKGNEKDVKVVLEERE